MRWSAWVFAGVAFLSAAVAQARPQATTIMISIDGFRADYMDRGLTPNLSALARDGVRSALRPSFPSVTFPNHFTLVTGLYPDHHGLVDNHIEDHDLGEVWDIGNPSHWGDPEWWNGVSIWATALAQGVTPAVEFWPSYGAGPSGRLPALFEQFDRKTSMHGEVVKMLSWLDLPPGRRPGLVLGYFFPVDHAGHEFGPHSAQVNQQIADADAAIGELVSGLKARGLYGSTNLIIVADHGMTEVGPGKQIVLDDYVDPVSIHIVTSGPVAGLEPVAGAGAAASAALLGRRGHMTCWRKSALPARFHYGSNRRIPPIICLADVGWTIGTRAQLSKHRDAGDHGYDPDTPDMAAIFVAHGPAFRRAVMWPKFDNVDVYPMLARIIGVRPEPNDGRLSEVVGMLR